jgi:hypothetical protein
MRISALAVLAMMLAASVASAEPRHRRDYHDARDRGYRYDRGDRYESRNRWSFSLGYSNFGHRDSWYGGVTYGRGYDNYRPVYSAPSPRHTFSYRSYDPCPPRVYVPTYCPPTYYAPPCSTPSYYGGGNVRIYYRD